MHKLTIVISERDKVKDLQKLALSLGYIQNRGPAKGQGSISAMVEALAQGQLIVSRKDTK